MHMSDALLSPAVAAIMTGVSGGAVAFAAFRLKKEGLEDHSPPMMGVMGAFVFAAQMINFTIPGTGSSGHIGGGVLLAALLGPWAGLLTLTAVLLIQCLFFADGGLLALGCNIFNLGVLTCLVSSVCVFKPIMGRGFSKRRVMAASISACVVGLQLGSFGVVLETALSGVAVLPLGSFAALMQPIHLAIGLVEGLVTGAVLCFVVNARPSLLTFSNVDKVERAPFKDFILIFIVLALLIGGGLSLYASSHPDGLEWSILNVAGTEDVGSASDLHERAEKTVSRSSVFQDYEVEGAGEFSTSLAGIIGSLMAVVLAGGAGMLLRARRRRRRCAGDL